MAERLIAAVLKTAVGDEPTVGSNPSLSAQTKGTSNGCLLCFMRYFVYIHYSLGHDRYYIGQTNDLTDRLSRHNELIDLNVMY